MRHKQPLLYILWDHSEIWGLIAARAARTMALPCRLVTARDLAGGALERERPSLLLVPGGNARLKAESLGRAGLEALRAYVAGGGRYLGFCGGAGLALSWGTEADCAGLGLCPVERGNFDERLQHFMSGHLHVCLPGRGGKAAALVPEQLPPAPCLPVWWPGRFAETARSSVEVLASYEVPAQDFWLADLPIAALPGGIFTDWNNVYGLALNPAFLTGQPCMLYGEYGRGAYVLSYSHLETPDSPQANAWLAHLFRVLGGLEPGLEQLPPWRCFAPASWSSPASAASLANPPGLTGPGCSEGPDRPVWSVWPLWEDEDLGQLAALLGQALQTGLNHGLLFHRTDWLLGWRYGLPGASLNNLRAALNAIGESEPTNAARRFWREQRRDTRAAMEVFAGGCVQYLLAERLSMTLSKALPEALPASMLKDQREALFGPPMRAGGLYRDLLRVLDELARLQLETI
ncbi:biotin--protein ligase [Desulfovibrio sp. OttesenSCG-928-G11]|nr:biotin--protein ligase [Desulfovibrio sp. OttesenSCG-928-G11]